MTAVARVLAWLRNLFGLPLAPEAETSWHVETVRGRWDNDAWKWDERSPKYLLISCWPTREDAERDAGWIRMSIHVASSIVTGPHNHARNTCGAECLAQAQKYTADRETAAAERRAGRIAQQQAGDWIDAITGGANLKARSGK